VLGDIEISSHTGLLFEVDNSAATPVDAMFINSSGRVGIGTVSPSAILSVGATSQFRVDTDGNLDRINNLEYDSWPSSHTTDGFLKNDGSGTLTWTVINAVEATGTPSGSSSGGQVSFWTGSDTISGDDDLYWDDVNKRLGIGTNMPQSSLDVASSGVSGGVISNSSGDITITPADNLIISQGDVGIGTDTPTAKLHIVGSSILLKNSADEEMTFTLDSGDTATQRTLIRFRDSSATGVELRYSLQKTNTNAFQLYDHVNVASRFLVGEGGNSDIELRTIGTGQFKFMNDTSTLMTILNTGNVGIGTASPSQKLDIDGQVRIRGGSPGVGKVLISDADGVGTWEDPDAFDCPTGMIPVPPSSSGRPGFCVDKYEAKQSGSVAVSQAAGTPWVSINQQDARGACRAAGKRLITEEDWLHIAQDVEQVGWNWSGGTPGSGQMSDGHSDNSPANSLAASTDDDPCSGTGQTCDTSTWNSQRRTYRLSNGEYIWDFGGNVWNWVDAFTYDGYPYINNWSNWAACSTPDAICGNTLATNDQRYGGNTTALRALPRGGHWHSGTNAGAFTVSLSSVPSNTTTIVGFRCAW
jgi:hypothetical protein